VTNSIIAFVAPGPAVFGGFTFSGTYAVNSNGTGTIALAAVPGQGAQYFTFVITDGGSGLLWLQTNRLGNGVLSGSARIQ
jgi:hypothetical protein